MKIKSHFTLANIAVTGIALMSIATAQLKADASLVLAQTLSPAERNELQRLRQEKEKLQQENQIRNLVQSEVDRAFSHSTNLINILLFVMTLFPIVTALGVWLLRRSVIDRLVLEIKNELQTEVEKQLEAEVALEFKKQTAAFKQEMEKLQDEYVSHLSQLQSLFIEAQKEKDKIIQEITSIMPSSLSEPIPAEVQTKMVELTNQLEALTAETQLFFTADDYVKQGDALYFENRYEAAIECYDKAIKIEPNNVDIWFFKGYVLQKLGRYDEAIACYDKTIEMYPDEMDNWYYKACCYALQGNARLAVETLSVASQINSRCLKWAANNPDFDRIRQDEAFQQLVSGLELTELGNGAIAENHQTNPPESAPETEIFSPNPSQTLMAQDSQELQNHHLLGIDDYLEQGNILLSQGRYEDANQSYNEALKLDRNLPEIRYQNAKTYALRGSVNPALGNLQWAIDLDSKYKEIAKTEPAFDGIRENEQFQKLVYD